MNGPRRILFVELLGGFGDVAIALPAIRALARSHPQARLDLLSFRPGDELVGADPAVAATWTAEPGRAREAVARRLRSGGYDLVVSDTAYDGIAELIADHAPRAVTDLWRDPPAGQAVGERFLDILADEGLIRRDSPRAARIALSDADRAGLPPRDGARPEIALLIDAGMPIKRWPEARFAELGRALAARGARLHVVAGGDRGAGARVARSIGAGAALAPAMPLRRLAAFLERCAAAVSADTGPGRIAALAGVPVVMIFGPAWAGRYAPGPGHAALQGRPGCPERRPEDFTRQRCWYAGACPLPGPQRSCVEDVGVPEVLEAVLARLPARGVRAG